MLISRNKHKITGLWLLVSGRWHLASLRRAQPSRSKEQEASGLNDETLRNEPLANFKRLMRRM